MVRRETHHTKRDSETNAKYNDLNEDLKDMRDVFSQTATDVKQNLAQTIQDAKDKSTELQKNVKHYVKNNPYKAVGWGMLAGFVMGLMFRK